MSADLATLSDKVAAVSDIYAQRNGIDRTEDWFLLKLQEELGELTAEYLKLSGRARRKGADDLAVRSALADEAADVLAMLMLFAREHDIDLASALERKWFQYLPSVEA